MRPFARGTGSAPPLEVGYWADDLNYARAAVVLAAQRRGGDGNGPYFDLTIFSTGVLTFPICSARKRFTRLVGVDEAKSRLSKILGMLSIPPVRALGE